MNKTKEVIQLTKLLDHKNLTILLNLFKKENIPLTVTQIHTKLRWAQPPTSAFLNKLFSLGIAKRERGKQGSEWGRHMFYYADLDRLEQLRKIISEGFADIHAKIFE